VSEADPIEIARRLYDWLSHFEEKILDEGLLEKNLERQFLDDMRSAEEFLKTEP
jgi:hypothetical protein